MRRYLVHSTRDEFGVARTVRNKAAVASILAPPLLPATVGLSVGCKMSKRSGFAAECALEAIRRIRVLSIEDFGDEC